MRRLAHLQASRHLRGFSEENRRLLRGILPKLQSNLLNRFEWKILGLRVKSQIRANTPIEVSPSGA